MKIYKIVILYIKTLNLLNTSVSGEKWLFMSSGLPVVLSKFSRSLLVPPKSHTLGFLPAFSDGGLFGLFLKKENIIQVIETL